MTIPGFGRLTPVQMDMLELAGINLDCRRYGFDPFNPGAEAVPDEDRIVEKIGEQIGVSSFYFPNPAPCSRP